MLDRPGRFRMFAHPLHRIHSSLTPSVFDLMVPGGVPGNRDSIYQLPLEVSSEAQKETWS